MKVAPSKPTHPVRRRAVIALIVAAALALAAAVGNYAAYAAGLAQANYTWFTPGAGDYVLSRPGDIYAFAEIVNGTQPSAINGGNAYSFEGETVHIATGRTPDISDINDPLLKDETGVAGQLPLNVALTRYEFEPIGTEAHPFQGTFDGGGVTLLNLLIDQNAPAAADPRGLGLFGVVGENAIIKDFTVTGIIVLKTGDPIENLGGAAGLVLGSMENVHSRVNITIENTAAVVEEGEEHPTTTSMTNIGGVAGRAARSIANCTYDANLTIKSDLDAAENDGAAPVPTCKYVGGVTGVLGSTTEATPGVAATSCYNYGNLYTPFTGSGGLDNWGTPISAKPSTIGGIAGYATGSFYSCGNEGELRTSARLADSGGATGSSIAKYDSTYDNGASNLGGIVGSLRPTASVDAYVSGMRDDVLLVKDCYNTGAVIGSDTVGGIAGEAGDHTLITGCANGNRLAANTNREEDNTTTPDFQGLVLTTRWNKPYGAGIVSRTAGSISYCYNRGEVNNTQSGYYQAGICGNFGVATDSTLMELILKDDPSYQCECYGCYNTGAIGPGHDVSARYGALMGENAGYVHDCAIREGCVGVSSYGSSSYNNSFAIGASVWNRYDSLEVFTMEELCSSTPTSVLNAQCDVDGGYAQGALRYWFTGRGTGSPDGNGNANYNDGFPVLTSWATPQNTIPLNAARLSELEVVDAVYKKDSEPVPTVRLSYTTDAGETVELYQNGDYLIYPEEGAISRTDDDPMDSQPYKYSVQGIGLYSGYVSDFGNYGITVGSLDDMAVVVDRRDEDKQTFNWEVQFPNSVELVDSAGGIVDEADYSWVIYDSMTHSYTASQAPKMPVFDSDGYIVFDDAPTEYVPALEAVSTVNQTVSPEAKRSFKVYDRDKLLISDSNGYVYDEFGNMTSGKSIQRNNADVDGNATVSTSTVGYSCIGYKTSVWGNFGDNNGDAGYVVGIFGKGDYEGATTSGRYNIGQPYLDADCVIQAQMPDGSFYELRTMEDGERSFYSIAEQRFVTADDIVEQFSASSIRPPMTATYLGRELRQYETDYVNDRTSLTYGGDTSVGYDCGVGYGGPEVSNVLGSFTPEHLRNRNATSDEGGYGARANMSVAYNLYLDDYTTFVPYVRPFQGFVDFDFSIEPISCEDVSIEVLETTALAAEGVQVESPVTVTLGEQVLIEGMDYAVEYFDGEGTLVESVNEEGNAEACAPSDPGTYTAKVIMLPLNFMDTLEENGIASEFSFQILEQGKPFLVQTEERNYTVSSGTYDPSGDYIEDTPWDVGYLKPDLTFLQLDDEGNVVYGDDGQLQVNEDMQFGRDFVYTINAYEPDGAVLNGDTANYWGALYEDIDGVYAAFYASQVMNGSRSLWITIEGKGAYAGCTQSVRWKLTSLDVADTSLDDWEIKGLNATRGIRLIEKDHSVVSTFSVKCKGFYVNYGSFKLVTLSTDPESPVQAGDVLPVVVKGSQGFTGSVLAGVDCQIEPFDITGSEMVFSFTLEKSSYAYDGTAHEPAVTFPSLTASADFFVDYQDNVDVGTATVIVQGDYTYSGGQQGNYQGTRLLRFAIKARDIQTAFQARQVTVSPIPDQSFTGDEIRPEVTVTDAGLAEGHDPDLEELVPGRDYVLEYADNVDAGTATVLIKGIGNYTGTITRTFTINTDPANVRLYVEFAYALDTGRKLAATASTLVEATALPDYAEGEDGFSYEVSARDFVDAWTVLADGTEVHTIGGKQFKLQGDGVKTVQLGLKAKNVVTFEYLNQNPDGTFESMPQVEGMAVDKVMRASDAYAKATVYPTTLNQAVEWKSSDVDIASVDPDTGLIRTGAKPGVVKLTATSVYDREQSASLYLANAGTAPRTVTQNGIQVTGVPEEVRLVLTPSEVAKSWLGAYDTMLACFDIRFETDVMDAEGNVLDTVECQPAGSVTVALTLPDGLTVDALYESKCFAYHYADDGSLIEPLSVSPQDAGLTFTLNHFSHVEIFGTIYDDVSNVVTPDTGTVIVRDPVTPPEEEFPPLVPGFDQGGLGGAHVPEDGTGSESSTGSGSGRGVQDEPLTGSDTVVDDASGEVVSVSDAEPLASTGEELTTFGNAAAETAEAGETAVQDESDPGIDWPLVLTVAVLLLAAAGGVAYNVLRIRKGGSAR